MASPVVPFRGHRVRRTSVFMWPIIGSMALRRRSSFATVLCLQPHKHNAVEDERDQGMRADAVYADDDVIHEYLSLEWPASFEEDRTVMVRDRQAPMKSHLARWRRQDLPEILFDIPNFT